MNKKFILLLSVLALVSGQCPKPEAITPCKCIINQNFLPDLTCEGNDIKDLSAILKEKLKASVEGNALKFGLLKINSTSITSIDSESFGDAIFDQISITDNTNLTKIDKNAFIKSAEAKSVRVFDVFNSPNYENPENLFAIVNSLQVKVKIGFLNVSLKQIPDDAFESNPKLTAILIQFNPITRIGKSAFSSLKNLTQLILNGNNITEIDSNGLTFDLTNSEQKSDVLVVLNQNKLTEKGFHESWSNSRTMNTNRKIKFEINSNHLTTLPENIFKPVLLSSNTRYMSFGDNRFKCDCNMKYLLTLKSIIENKLTYTMCQNFVKNILQVDVEDLGQC